MSDEEEITCTLNVTLDDFSIQATGKVVTNFALTHFNSAKYFSSKVQEIESANVNQPFGNFFEEISMYCSSCIITGAASLEALINELYIAPGPIQNEISDFNLFFWGEKDKKGFVWQPTLKKYKKALSLLKMPELNYSDSPYKNAIALFKFRNYLMHFKPLWDDDYKDKNLEEELTGLFKLSPFTDSGADFFAQKCMTKGCCDWVVSTVVNFIQDFANKSELDPKKLGMFK